MNSMAEGSAEMAENRALDLSVLIPVYNEVDNVEPLHNELDAVLRGRPFRYELIFVNDGSTDGTAARLEAIQRSDPEHVRVAFLRRNCGQTAALSAALDLARGVILIPMDGDRQNDPADIPRLLDALGAGFDVVSGWRKDRQDALISRKVPSWLANRLIARLSGVPLHDFGCTLKAYRRNVLEGVRLYGEMHRFIPIFATWQGARVTELVVNHRPAHRRQDQVRNRPDISRRPRPHSHPLPSALLPASPPFLRPVRTLVVRPEHPLFRGDALLQVSLPLAPSLVGL